jgi:Sec-independent protein translocase protein TatA
MEFSFGELLVVGFIAFLVLGPEDFVRFAGRAGKFLGKARDQFNNFKVLAQEEVMAADEKAKLTSKGKLESKEDDLGD